MEKCFKIEKINTQKQNSIKYIENDGVIEFNQTNNTIYMVGCLKNIVKIKENQKSWVKPKLYVKIKPNYINKIIKIKSSEIFKEIQDTFFEELEK